MKNSPNNSIKSHWLILMALVVIAIWSETFVSSKILLSTGLMPADIFFFRFLLSYVCLVAISHKRLWAKTLKHELLFFASGVAGGSLYFLTENMALKFSTASNVAIIVGTTPLMTALILACFYKDERMNRRQLIGSLLAFLGLILVVLNGQFVLHLNPLGDVLALSASITWGFYSLFMKTLSTQYDTQFITRKVFAYGLISILPWFVCIEPLQTNWQLLQRPGVWINIVYLGLVASLLCFLAWNWLLPRLGVVKSTNIIYTQCAFTMIISAAVLGETITLMAITGTIILIGGMLLISHKKK